MALFDGLEEIDWSALQHAYGAAEDVPELLLALGDPDASEAELRTTKDTLWGNLFHQGSRYEASAHAVPFFFELLRDGNVSEEVAAFALTYLHHLALGYPSDRFPERPAPDTWAHSKWILSEDETRSLKMEKASAKFPRSSEIARRLETHWALQTYFAVEAGIEAALPSLFHAEAKVAEAACALVADFPRRANATVPALLQAQAERTHDGRGAALLALALLGHDTAELLPTALNSASEEERIYAACAAVFSTPAHVSDAVVAILIAPASAGLAKTANPFANTFGALVGAALTCLPATHHGQAIAALASAHQAADAIATLQLSQQMLRLAFPTAPPEEASALTAAQREALEAILSHGAWTLPKGGKGTFSNYTNVLRAFRLPDSAEALRTWLASNATATNTEA
jgi:hypothetical protein